jgi:hypothetical protein
LGEKRLRDLNGTIILRYNAITLKIKKIIDDINKQLREKAHWERRILELGGPNYRVSIIDETAHQLNIQRNLKELQRKRQVKYQ